MLLPMLCTSSTPASGRPGADFRQLMESGDWIADTKLDGVRALAHWTGRTLVLGNRNGVDITKRYPEVVAELEQVLDGEHPMVVDGEIVAKDGSFESTLLRDKQSDKHAIERLSFSHPTMFCAFDIADDEGTWVERRNMLTELFDGRLQLTVVSDSPEFLADTQKLGMEGVVAKRKTSIYRPGFRSKQWVKFRNRFRVTCLVAGYEPGHGSRSHFGAMHLALLRDGEPVSVGRVGTGFTEREIDRLKKALDAGEILTVEIECANQTSTGQLRFPVYRGVRTDVGIADCSIEQLSFLPTC